MFFQLVTLCLAPLLIFQGRRVRRDTPKLPEPDGIRYGNLGEGKPLRLLIAGDSAAAGVGVETQDLALAGMLSSRLSEHFKVSWKLVAQTGYTVSDLIQRLESESAENYDVGLISIGVNDVTDRTSMSNWEKQVDQLSELLRQKFSVRKVLFTSVPPMHLFPALPQPLRWYLGWRAEMLDRSMKAVLGNQPGVEVIKSFTDPDPQFMATDGFHPGQHGYEIWASVVAQTLLEEASVS
ncbi:hypothetical protein BTA51_03685 [Hahella sp. CCB-MM4]|uniref:SGNH/GDSL hydrolase family protein n=1 Tax=Hahella sp. (strain CCB-MM4) TaxID=1926491 RepID=UPI000B9A6856|nr:SGNH/GDSL hydrolase family protein [Hahella sp. CCB-MM4]OZG74135.1 hypothetical protein BTA51_03685 [Hahella sp. CCB-MM4]